MNLEIKIKVRNNLFSTYLECIKDVEVLAMFSEAVIATKSWVRKCLFLFPNGGSGVGWSFLVVVTYRILSSFLFYLLNRLQKQQWFSEIFLSAETQLVHLPACEWKYLCSPCFQCIPYT